MFFVILNTDFIRFSINFRYVIYIKNFPIYFAADFIDRFMINTQKTLVQNKYHIFRIIKRAKNSLIFSKIERTPYNLVRLMQRFSIWDARTPRGCKKGLLGVQTSLL